MTTATPARRGIHIPVDDIDERAQDIQIGRAVTMALLAIPYFLCFLVARIVTRFIAACQEGWYAGARPKGK